MKKLLLSLAVAFSMYGSAEAGIIRGTLPDGTELRAEVTPKGGEIPAEMTPPGATGSDIVKLTYEDPDVRGSAFIIFVGPFDKTWTTDEILWYIKVQLAIYYDVSYFDI